MAKRGRPLKFKNAKELQVLIDAYFKMCDDNVLPYTITGLAVALDTSRETLMNYEEKEQFFDTIKRAKAKCEWYAEKELYLGKNAAGPIFALKNYGWKDKQETEHSGTVGVTVNVVQYGDADDTA